MLTTDPIYWKPLKPKIIVQNLPKSTTYYTYDGLVDTATVKPVYCRVQLGLDHTGTFEVQFENSGQTLDTTNIKAGNRCIISLSKDSTLAFNTLISGLIRKTTYERGIGGQALYTISGSSTAIRLNENVTYRVSEARKLAQDNLTIDISDPNFKADTLLQSVLSTPTGPATSTAGGYIDAESSYGIIVPTNLATNSDVENFIPSIAIQYGQLQDAANLVEEQTDAEVFVDVNDLVQLRHQFQPFTSGRGFILTDSQGVADNADYTCYIEPNSPPSYSESKYVSDGYSSKVVGILPAETAPSKMEDLGWRDPPSSFGTTDTTVEYAQKFRPTHNYYLPGDIFIVGSQWTTGATGGSNWNPIFRICTDTAGVPTNAGGVVANIMFRYRVWPDTIQNGNAGIANLYRLTNDQLFYSPTMSMYSAGFVLDTTKDYWLISSNQGLVANLRFSWAQDVAPLVTPSGGTMQHTANFSTISAGGSSWTSVGSKPCFAMPRMRSQAFFATDPKAIAATGSGLAAGGLPIVSVLSNVSNLVTTKDAMYKYLVNQLYYQARPKVTWSTMVISPPNIPIFPNDPIMVVDSTLNFSTSGTQVVTATVGDMVYEFGERGGTGSSFRSNLHLNIQPVGMANHY